MSSDFGNLDPTDHIKVREDHALRLISGGVMSSFGTRGVLSIPPFEIAEYGLFPTFTTMKWPISGFP